MVRVREPEPIAARPERWKYTPPKLNNGDRLSLAEFNYLYKNSPHIRRAELIEGVVYVASPKKVFWFRWVDGVYVEIKPDENGVYKSVVFPELWLDSVAFWERDGMALMEALQAGIKSAEHVQFAETFRQSATKVE